MRFKAIIHDVKTFAAACAAIKHTCRSALLHVNKDKIRVIAPQLDRIHHNNNNNPNTHTNMDGAEQNQNTASPDTCVWAYLSKEDIFDKDNFVIESVTDNNIYIEVYDIAYLAFALKCCDRNFEKCCENAIRKKEKEKNPNDMFRFKDDSNSNDVDDGNEYDVDDDHLLSTTNDEHARRIKRMKTDKEQQDHLKKFSPIIRLIAIKDHKLWQEYEKKRLANPNDPDLQTPPQKQALLITQSHVIDDDKDTDATRDFSYEIPVRCINVDEFTTAAKPLARFDVSYKIHRFNLQSLSLLIDRLRSCRVSHVRVGVEAHFMEEVKLTEREVQEIKGKIVQETYRGGGFLTLQARAAGLDFCADISMGEAITDKNNKHSGELGHLVEYTKRQHKSQYFKNRGGHTICNDSDPWRNINNLMNQQQQINVDAANSTTNGGGDDDDSQRPHEHDILDKKEQQRLNLFQEFGNSNSASKHIIFDRRKNVDNTTNDGDNNNHGQKSHHQHIRRQRQGENDDDEQELINNNDNEHDDDNDGIQNQNNHQSLNINNPNYASKQQIKRFFKNPESIPDDSSCDYFFSTVTEIGIELKYLTKVLSCVKETNPRAVEWYVIPGRGFVFNLFITKTMRMCFQISGANINDLDL